MKTYTITLYSCGCGYETFNNGNASKHKNTKCGRDMKSESKEFVLKETVGAVQNDVKNEQMISQLNATIENLKNSLEFSNMKVKSLCRKMSKHAHISTEHDEYLQNMMDDVEYHGLVYFVIDADLPDRGKIGRTMNTDVMKLRSRYTTFGLPNIMCYLSTNIKRDENDLKKLMREAGCMKSNTELVSNVIIATRIFNDFVIDRFKMKSTIQSNSTR
jgi:hypothetical protein